MLQLINFWVGQTLMYRHVPYRKKGRKNSSYSFFLNCFNNFIRMPIRLHCKKIYMASVISYAWPVLVMVMYGLVE